MSDKCNIEGCNRDCFQDSNQCVLHCDKHDYSTDYYNISILRNFYDELIDYIIENILEFRRIQVDNKELLREYLRSGEASEEIRDLFKDEVIVFNLIFFPCRDARDKFDYLRVLTQLKGIHFNYCSFSATSLNIQDVQVFYQDCNFKQYWMIQNTSLLENVNNVIYQSCIFNNEVSISAWDGDNTLDIALFTDCIFHQKLSFENMIFENKIFINSNDSEIEIDALRITKCVLQDDFILNNLNARSILIKNTDFKSKFEMKDSHITMMFEVINTNFLGLFDIQNSTLGGFECFKCTFSNVASFEHCAFSFERKNKEYMAIFKYTTFLSFTSFRNSRFHLGLDLENANLKEAPNFLNIQLLSDNTNRETLRIIKNSFDKIGNHIDANNFFVKEMKKYKQELSRQGGNWQERMILWFNEKASDFGQSYIKPIVWLLLIAMIYSGLIYAQENDYLYRIYPPFNNALLWLSQSINGVAKNIIPFKSFAKEGMEFLSLIFYIIFASLTWQTIVAFKRHTKR